MESKIEIEFLKSTLENNSLTREQRDAVKYAITILKKKHTTEQLIQLLKILVPLIGIGVKISHL